MKYRRLGKTGLNISEISLGTWQVGGKWGSGFDHDNADKILHAAIDAGINFIDTADVYEMGESEKAVGRVVGQRAEEVFVATKCGRQIQPHVDKGYTRDVLQKYVEDSLQRMNLECIDLIQLHCPPTETYYRPEIFELFDRLREQGKIKNLGVSVEKVEEAIKAMEYDNVTAVQIIFNVFRQRPAELFFEQVKKKDVGVIARVPLASGLLTGKYHSNMEFGKGDHRNYNRNGEAFDKGETFSGIDFETGLAAVEELKAIFPEETELAHKALQWILSFEEVSTIIPGASRVEQITSNLKATEDAVSAEEKARMDDIYKTRIKPLVHQLW